MPGSRSHSRIDSQPCSSVDAYSSASSAVVRGTSFFFLWLFFGGAALFFGGFLLTLLLFLAGVRCGAKVHDVTGQVSKFGMPV